ncbi:hypothetical protein M8C21_003409 [Ambrosia artemisiifolia]|uniref:Replication factor A C-terminal domain-containing protein n=1 Tax=Ambrosia artemisiifolia TaxID=4212 RepID=A0AAD5C2J5_AMBAR|nr:hypothetical protein M8C21_003409 [Ambrosia artemisiifolia]
MNITDEFLNKTPFSTIRDLPLTTEVNKQVEPTLSLPDDNEETDVTSFKQVLVCTNKDCPKHIVSADPVIPIRVQDFTGITSLTLFDREAKKLLGMSAMQLLQISKQVSGEEKTTPPEFHVFEDKKFAFKIKVGQFNIDKHLDGYGIRKLTNESSIVASLEERFSDIQVDQPGFENLDVGESSTQNAVSVKDSVGDNNTPESSCRVSFIHDEQEVKRSLDKVYELDDDATESTTKVLRTHKKVYTDKSPETPFLIPKVEK